MSNRLAVTTAQKQPAQKLERFQWAPGQSGNPKGRPKGSRHKLSEAFIAAIATDFEQHGTAVIEKVRRTKPHEYLKVVASLLPKDVNLNRDKSPLDELSDDELEQHMAWLQRVMAHFGTPEALERLADEIGGEH